MYKRIRCKKLDFAGEGYDNLYPNLHKYPATMLPQLAGELLVDLGISGGRMLDPYCGSGSSFTAGLDHGTKHMVGYDINPLAILIAKARFTKIPPKELRKYSDKLRESFAKNRAGLQNIERPNFFNVDFWFSSRVIEMLAKLRFLILSVPNSKIRDFLLVPFSETVRECSYTRNGEFKLFRMAPEKRENFFPDVFRIYFRKLERAIYVYRHYYYPKLNGVKVFLKTSSYKYDGAKFDYVLTSPPYGDSRTTVAYGQFSALSGEWLGFRESRKIDNRLMGGVVKKKLYETGEMRQYIAAIKKESERRAFEVSSFYFDLDKSIKDVAKCLKKNGFAIYVIGNRTVKNITLPTDEFIKDSFVKNSCRHIKTYKRLISGKSMPASNSPTNKKGKKVKTMNEEYVVICQRV